MIIYYLYESKIKKEECVMRTIQQIWLDETVIIKAR